MEVPSIPLRLNVVLVGLASGIDISCVGPTKSLKRLPRCHTM